MKSRYVCNWVNSFIEPKEQDGWESCLEEEDGDSNGKWIDVHHSSDEEQVCI